MKLTFKTIIQNYFHRFHADVSMAAHSVTNKGWQSEQPPEFYRLWFIKDGEGGLQIKDQCYELKPGRLLMLPPGAQQFFGPSEGQFVSLYWCNFRATIGDMDLFDILNLKVSIALNEQEQEHIVSLFKHLIAAYQSETLTRGLRVRAALFEMMAYFLEYSGFNEKKFLEIEPIAKINHVLEYIEEHLSEQISVDELAKLAFLHPNYFIGYFKNIVGYAPTQFINIRKMERAKTLLEDVNIQIAEVASQIGLQNHYLSRLFKQYTGLTPKRYRQIYVYNTQQGKDNE
ncbi:AraC family transcriptional regulator [Paenibacillus sp. OV219]|uniref:AraC family transcriptional regulator n=1 Tax=Paenibacillus sp. OV219 TaxID=1884377 RepID=UPI0008C06286|nr:AraC family transcriptional regulator [Paenibacillus sp. OV219]SEP11389.1 transcriptional regulator, AraC family [Paenibacillus sp. OV219]